MFFLKPESLDKIRKHQPEHKAQSMFVQYARLVLGKKWRLVFAIPNGGKRDVRAGKKLKDEGMLSGVPDIFVAIPKGIYSGLFIEMKSGYNKPTESQKEQIDALRNAGYKAEVCTGFDQAKEVFDKYLSL